MVVDQYKCSDEIENPDQAVSISLQPCSSLSNTAPVVDYATKKKADAKYIQAVTGNYWEVGAFLGSWSCDPLVRIHLLIRAKAPIQARDRVLGSNLTKPVGYGAKNGVPA
jgi:hypothetical protein